MNDIIKEIIERVELNARYYKRVEEIERLIEKKRASAATKEERKKLFERIRENNAAIAELFMQAAPNGNKLND